MTEEYHAQHRRCPRCGGLDITRTRSGEKVKRGEPYRDNDGAACKSCGWDGIILYLVPVDTISGRGIDRPLPVGEPVTAGVIDSLIQTLRHRELVLTENRVTLRGAEYQQLVKEYVKLVQTRTAFMDQAATEIALALTQQIKDLGDLLPDDGLLSHLRILCGTRYAVPTNLLALYTALHGKPEEA